MTRPPIPLYLDDVVTLRKSHPCGGATWQIVRLGADIGIRCLTCGRRVLIGRAELERRIKRFEKRGPMAPDPSDVTLTGTQKTERKGPPPAADAVG